MNNFIRAIIAGMGARYFGGGCLGTVIVFILIWVALGQCSNITKEQKESKPPIEHKKRKVESVFVNKEYYCLPGLNKSYIPSVLIYKVA